MPSVFDVLQLLTPYDIDRKKRRRGRQGDGGYIFANLLKPSQSILSFGIGREITFDLQMARRGHKVFMFDHTIEAPRKSHPNFTFFRKGIGASHQVGEQLMTLDQHLSACAVEDRHLILKIDVEGAEWDVFSEISPATLARFDHLAIEVHGLKNLDIPEFREKVYQSLSRINEQFTLFHVHANCVSKIATVDGFPVANLLELSFVRTSLVDRRPSQTIYPTELDFPCVAHCPEIKLWFFPFYPRPDMNPDREIALGSRSEVDAKSLGRNFFKRLRQPLRWFGRGRSRS